jgi:hypothetical protein
MRIDPIQVTGLVLSILAIFTFSVFVVNNTFPAFDFAISDQDLIEIDESTGDEASAFMWDYRGIELLAQSFVLFLTAVGSLALLRDIASQRDERTL